jgi:hypothetical protein
MQGQVVPLKALFIVESQVRQLVLVPEQVRHLLSHLEQSSSVVDVS